MFSWEFQTVSAGDGEPRPGKRVNVVAHNNAGQLGMMSMRWGFDEYYNTRLETASTKPLWRESFAERRGVMMAASFWEKEGQFGATDGQPLLFGCIWKLSPYRMTSMLTMPSCPPVTAVHHRMPVIIPRAMLDEWCSRDSSASTLGTRLLDTTPELVQVA